MYLVKKLKYSRESKGLSQSQLAKASGVNVRMIQNYEQGIRDINKAEALTVYKLAKSLDVEMSELLELDQ